MLNVGIQLLPKATVQAGTADFPFAFDLPPDALPSYSGKNAHVTWKLSTRADIPWGSDLQTELFLPIMKSQTSPPAPAAMENNEASPRIRLTLSSNLYQPGETILGKLTLVEPGKIRGVRLQLSIAEQSTGVRGTWTGTDKTNVTENLPIGNPLACSQDQLAAAREIPFQIQLSPYTSCSYVGLYSSITWYIYATLDIPHGADFHFALPFAVGLRSDQPHATAAPSSTAPETVQPVQPEPVSQTLEATDPASIIVKILADGSPKDIVAISSQLREEAGTFYDLNQVKELCEKLVLEGKLERTSQGEFLAQYSLKW